MQSSDVQKNSQYERFFMMKGESGRRKLVGNQSTVDNVIYGRDIDASGPNPHLEVMTKFDDHAGVKSGEKPERSPKKRIDAMGAATVDEVVFHRDVDNSGPDPHGEHTKGYTSHAGNIRPAGLREDRDNLRKPHTKKHASTLDSAVLNRDVDNSGGDPHGDWQKNYNGHAGVSTKYSAQRPMRKKNIPHAESMGALVGGKSGVNKEHQQFQEKHSANAGVKAGELNTSRPYRPYGVSQTAKADEVVFNRDVDLSTGKTQSEAFAQEKYKDFAGKDSGSRPKRGPKASPSVASDTKSLASSRGGRPWASPTSASSAAAPSPQSTSQAGRAAARRDSTITTSTINSLRMPASARRDSLASCGLSSSSRQRPAAAFKPESRRSSQCSQLSAWTATTGNGASMIAE